MEIQRMLLVLCMAGISLPTLNTLTIHNRETVKLTKDIWNLVKMGLKESNVQRKIFYDNNGMEERFLPKNFSIDNTISNELSLSSSRKRSNKHSKLNRVLRSDYFEMELQVIMDSVMMNAIKDTKIDTLEYLQIFFHTVNHMYENSYKNEIFPTFKVKVVEITELGKDKESQIFQPVEGDIVMDIEKVLVNLRKLSKKAKFDKYDHTILLTGRDLYRKVGSQYEPDVLGVAFLKGACTKLADGKYNALSVVEDVGARFLGVYAAVHEIAHNLGVKHDAKTGSFKCHASRGYIMSPVTARTNNMFQFSDCSLSSLKTFFDSDQSTCLTNKEHKPVFPENTPPKFPGDVFSMQDICNHLAEQKLENEVGWESIVNPGTDASSLCKQISCKITLSSGKTFTLEPPFAPGENAPCGQGGKCISGECITLQKQKQ